MTDTRGATAIEYAMIAGFISILVITAVNVIGQEVNTLYFGSVVSGL